MEKSVHTIGKEKFSKLSSRRQHELLMQLAKDAVKSHDFIYFKDRYKELHSCCQLDRYSPPGWLSDSEAAHEFIAFHNNFSMLKNESDDTDNPDTEISWQPKFEVEIVLDQVRSPYNVGSVLRLIDNFGFTGLVHSSSWLDLTHQQLKRSARGCQRWIPVKYVQNLIEYLKESRVSVTGIEIDSTAIPVFEWKPPEKCILVLGNETYGIASAIRELCNEIIYIPVAGYKKSMNVHHALAVAACKLVEPEF